MKTCTLFIAGLLLITIQGLTSQVVSYNYVEEDTLCKGENNFIARYNYFPNLEAYFDNKKKQYIFFELGVWVHRPTIAPNYRGYSTRNRIFVPLPEYSGDSPFNFLPEHKLKYPDNFSSKRQPKELYVTSKNAIL